MTTVTVIKRFWDRKAKVTRWPGDEFAETDERAAEIQGRLPDYVRLSANEPEPTDGNRDYSEMSAQELRALCEGLGLDVPKRAKKAQLIALLEG